MGKPSIYTDLAGFIPQDLSSISVALVGFVDSWKR